MKELHSEQILGDVIPNIATLLDKNVKLFGDKIVYQEKNDSGIYVGITWNDFYRDIQNIAYNLHEAGFTKDDKMVIFSKNCLKMLELQLAVMAYGAVVVPIFANFKQDTAELLINHSDAKWLALDGKSQLLALGNDLNLKKMFVFDDVTDDRFPDLVNFNNLLKPNAENKSYFDLNINPDEVCLNMYTSGTMGIPKCVQLMHKNILSQQAALKKVWDVNENDRFLAYLPWHHSFGGIFELFSALYNGATFSLESSYGRDAKMIFENWKLIKPTIFFSVPKVYQSLFDLTKESKEAENILFNSGLKFIFTAAAALPERLSNEF